VRDGAVTLNAAQLRLLFTGMDWTQIGTPPPRCPGDQLDPAIRICFVPVLMHGIKAGISHRFTRAVLMTRRFDGSPPRRIGAAVAPVAISQRVRKRIEEAFGWT
jgi:hypothetical protein